VSMTEALDVQLNQILAAEAACKGSRTCPRLTIRELYFEPNRGTLQAWRDAHGFYSRGIDTRLMFVCESPSDRRDRAEPPHFDVDGQPGWICWNLTWQDARFREMRIKHGLENCLITNAVKCGLERPSTPLNLTETEITNCADFLRQEVEAVCPRVLACLGGAAYRIVQEQVIPRLPVLVPAVQLTHYSHRCSNEELFSRWDRELLNVKAHLQRRS